MTFKNAGVLQVFLFMDTVDDCLALCSGTRSDMKIAKHVIMLRTFMCHYLCDATCADNQNILFHVGPKTPLF
jgi:hypothetical protein